MNKAPTPERGRRRADRSILRPSVWLGAGAAVALVAGIAAVNAPASAAQVRIHDIQGASHVSPLSGKDVSSVPGVVTGTSKTGFWMQDPKPDDDPATSEGIFVYTKSAPTVKVGDAASVTGKVTEYRPGGTANNLSTTEIGSPKVTVSSHGNSLPAATLIGKGGRTPPGKVIESGSPGDVEKSGVKFDPAKNGLDFWESLEGMRTSVKDAVAVGPTDSHNETPVLSQGEGSARTKRGGIEYTADDGNPERVILSSALASVPKASVGDTYTGTTTGVLDYDYGNYMLEPTSSPKVHSAGLKRQTASAASSDQLAMATFNVENLAPSDPQSKFDTLGGYIAKNLAAPDLLSVEEVQDNSGATDDGTVACDKTVAKLTAAIKAAGGPSYQWRSIDPANDKDGGEPGGNIRVGFLDRTDRGLKFVDRPGGNATTAVKVSKAGDGTAQLSASPGRIDPTNSAWNDSRKPLVGEFTWHGKKLIVIGNHWDSKGGDDPLMGRYQPPKQSSQTQRDQQATDVAGFVKKVKDVDPNANIIAAGDLNDFDFSKPVHTLTAAGMKDLPAGLPLNERYSYDYQGNSEVLDHVLLSSTLAEQHHTYQSVHLNSEFDDQISDHDPGLVHVNVG